MIEDDATETAVARKPVKSETAFRTISEVSEDLEVPQHVLRFWESKFPQIKPLKRGGGRRYYRPEDLQLLRRIRDLLYKDGYTIRGVQKLLRDQSRSHATTARKKDDAVEIAAPQPEDAGAQSAPDGDAAAVVTDDEAAASVPALTCESDGDDVITMTKDELAALLDELQELRDLLRQGRGE